MRRDEPSELRVVSPCHASWEEMPGTDQVRHCAQCRKNVFNISNMTRFEAAELLRQTEGRICVRYQQSDDGKPQTRDLSLRDRMSLKARLILVSVAAVLGITMSAGCTTTTGDISGDPQPAPSTPTQKPKSQPQHVLMGEIAVSPAPEKPHRVVMGDIASK